MNEPPPLYSHDALSLYNHGNTLIAQKRFEQALASYDGALTIRPDWPEVFAHRGIALHELTRFDEALSSYDRALTIRPNQTC